MRFLIILLLFQIEFCVTEIEMLSPLCRCEGMRRVLAVYFDNGRWLTIQLENDKRTETSKLYFKAIVFLEFLITSRHLIRLILYVFLQHNFIFYRSLNYIRLRTCKYSLY